LLTFEQFGNKILSHGREWKKTYGKLLEQFIQNRIFPADIEKELLNSLKNPAATSCAEDGLIRVLRKYDDIKSHNRLIEEIPANGIFQCDNGRIFKKGEKVRKRFQCTEIKTGRVYLFSPVYEVEIVYPLPKS
jgi:hypothetical protein